MTTLYLDVDTQLDFMVPAGALYVPGAERIIPTIAALNRHAVAQGAPLISTTDAHAEGDVEFREWPSHCVIGTLGQRKPAATLVGAGDRQIVFEKVTLASFAHPGFEPLLRRVDAERFVVYGVVTEVCVRLAVEGLLAHGLGKRVEIVEDAVRHLTAAGRDRALTALTRAGAKLTRTADILG
jgi:nicotinamidase/pyrazinamidase